MGLSFQTGQLEPLLSRFTQEEEMQMKRMLQRMDVLAKVRTKDVGRSRQSSPYAGSGQRSVHSGFLQLTAAH